jgi:tRNA1Val (adenine37-N6)-methyltransferase
MANPFFQFKQFTVWHDRCAMKVGTDAVLLGAWTDVTDVATILDIGTGSGILALMLAQKSLHAHIDAIDMDATAVNQAAENVEHSPWSDRIMVKHQSWQQFFAENSAQYDLIICNPPFFRHSLPSPNRQRTMARHDDHFEMISLLEAIPEHLQQHAHFDLVYPYRESEKLIKQAESCGLYCRRQTFVKALQHSLPTRCLLSFSTSNGSLSQHEIVIEDGKRHHYTPEYKMITSEFYLNF